MPRPIRISMDEIAAAWPGGIYDLFVSRGVKLTATADTFRPSNIRFKEPCRYWWDDGELVVEQW